MTYSATVLANSPSGYWRQGEPYFSVYGTATSSTNFSTEPAANAFDNNATTYWTTNAVSSGWVRNQLSAAFASTGYSIRRRDDIPARNPKDWTFQGSNDGTTWTTLDTQSGYTWPTSGETKSYTFANTTRYLYYRLNVTANNGDTYLSVAELTIAGVSRSTPTTMSDSSGNSHSGTYSNVVNGAAGALVGDSDTASTYSSAGPSRGNVPYAAWMALTSSFTVEAWIKTTGVGAQAIADRDAGSSRVFQFRTNGGSLEFIKISGGVVTASQATSINNGAWHHVVATYDGTSIRLYKDGSLINTTAAAGTLTGTDPFTIGSSDGGDGPFSGDIDEVAYYSSTVLSGAQVSAHYAAGTSSPDATVAAVVATATAAAATPTISAASSVSAVASTATAAASAPTVTGTGSATVAAVAATATAAATAPVVGADATLAAIAATATASAPTISVTADATVTAVSATATAQGIIPVVTNGSGNATVFAVAATATASAPAPVFTQIITAGTDTTNSYNGRNRHARATFTITRPVAAPASNLAPKYDKALPYPQPVMVNGRPT